MLTAMRLARLLDVLESIAPRHLAEPWDKVGLQVGEPSSAAPVNAAMLCIDLTRPVLREAIGRRCRLIVAYHPLIFEPLARLSDEEPRGAVVMEAVRRRIAVHSPHTALDAAPDGVSDWLCRGLGRGRVEVIASDQTRAQDYKLVTFVPPAHLDRVRQAMFDAGAGRIGAYGDCSFSHEGEGTFRGDAGTDPFIGRPGRLERVTERRLELACGGDRLDAAIRALRAAHPYEEPAFDVLVIHRPARSGTGRIVTLDRAVSATLLVRRIKAHLGVERVELAGGGRKIQRVAVCPGAGGSLLAGRRDVQAIFTGEMRHHDVLAAAQRGQCVLLAGHTQTERPYLPLLRAKLARACPGVRWFVSRADAAPLRGV